VRSSEAANRVQLVTFLNDGEIPALRQQIEVVSSAVPLAVRRASLRDRLACRGQRRH
jgi:hypothetical protein